MTSWELIGNGAVGAAFVWMLVEGVLRSRAEQRRQAEIIQMRDEIFERSVERATRDGER